MVWIMQLVHAAVMRAEDRRHSVYVYKNVRVKAFWVSKEVAVAKMSGKMRHLGFLLRLRMNCWSGKGLLEYEMK